MIWDQTNVAFREIPPDELRAATSACTRGEECVSCGLRQLRLDRESWSVEGDGGTLSHGGVTYHVDDYVYLRPDAPPPSLYIIGQIVEVVQARAKGQHRVKARLLERYDTVASYGPFKEGRRKDEVWLHRIVSHTTHIHSLHAYSAVSSSRRQPGPLISPRSRGKRMSCILTLWPRKASTNGPTPMITL